WVRQRQPLLSSILLGAAALFLVLAGYHVVLSFQGKSPNVPVALWAGAMALLGLFGGMYLRLAVPDGPDRPERRHRLLALGLGGLAGLFTCVLGIVLPLGPSALRVGP